MLFAFTESELLFTVIGVYTTLACLWLVYWVFEKLAHRGRKFRVNKIAREMRPESEVQPFVALPSPASDTKANEKPLAHDELGALRCQLANVTEALAEHQTRINALQSQLDALTASNVEAEFDPPASDAGGDGDQAVLSIFQPQLEHYDEDWATYDVDLGVVIARRPDDADDLTLIWGVGEVYQTQLHEHGVYYFRQIADWTQHNVDQFNALLSFKGRIEREEWVGQAKRLADQAQNHKAA